MSMTVSNDVVLVLSCCEECKKESALYQCPRCSRRTCSLSCCQAHKTRTGCNGKRDRTKFVSVGAMMRQQHDSDAAGPNDNHHHPQIQSDYFFLEDVLQSVHRSKRLLRTLGGGGGATNNTTNQNHQHHRQSTAEDSAMATTASSIPPPPPQQPPHPLLWKQQAPSVTETSDSLPSPQEHPSSFENGRQNSSGHHHHYGPNNNNNSTPLLLSSSPSTSSLPPKWRLLVQQAQQEQRGIHLMLMPFAMQRHATNTSFYNHKARTIFWKVEFRCHDNYNHHHHDNNSNNNLLSTTTRALTTEPSDPSPPHPETVLSVPKLSETASLWECWNRLQQQQQQSNPSIISSSPSSITSSSSSRAPSISTLPPQSQPPPKVVHLLIKRLPCPNNRPRYIQVPHPLQRDAKDDHDRNTNNNNNNPFNYRPDCLRVLLQGMTVIEHPTIEVVPHDRLDEFPLLIQPLLESISSSSSTEIPTTTIPPITKTVDVVDEQLLDQSITQEPPHPTASDNIVELQHES